MDKKNSRPTGAQTESSNVSSIPQLRYDGLLWIATADSLTSIQWRSGEASLSRLYARLARVQRTPTKGSAGGYVLTRLSGPRRVTEAVMLRSGLVFDFDHCDGVDIVWNEVLTLRCSAVLHTTHRHTPESPRCRVIIPMRRAMTVAEYAIVSRAVADHLGLDGLDASTHEPSRMMFFPSAPEGAEFVCRYHDAPWLDPDAYLTGTTVPTRRTWRMGTDDADARTAELRRISQGVGEGERNQAAARMAGYYFSRLDPEVALYSLENWNMANDPPLSLRELHTVAQSIARRQARKEVARHGA